jgi:hypothetical protein
MRPEGADFKNIFSNVRKQQKQTWPVYISFFYISSFILHFIVCNHDEKHLIWSISSPYNSLHQFFHRGLQSLPTFSSSMTIPGHV